MSRAHKQFCARQKPNSYTQYTLYDQDLVLERYF